MKMNTFYNWLLGAIRNIVQRLTHTVNDLKSVAEYSGEGSCTIIAYEFRDGTYVFRKDGKVIYVDSIDQLPRNARISRRLIQQPAQNNTEATEKEVSIDLDK